MGYVAERVFLLAQPLDVGDVKFEHFLDIEFKRVVRRGSRISRLFVTVAIELNVGNLQSMAGTVCGRQYVMMMVMMRGVVRKVLPNLFLKL